MVNNMQHAVRSTKAPDSRTRLTTIYWALSTAPSGALTHRDVKNEDRTGYVYENKDDDDKMSGEKQVFYMKMHPWREDQQESAGFLGRKSIGCAIIRGGGGPKNRLITIDGKLQITNRKSAIENRKWSDGPLARSSRLSIMFQKQNELAA